VLWAGDGEAELADNWKPERQRPRTSPCRRVRHGELATPNPYPLPAVSSLLNLDWLWTAIGLVLGAGAAFVLWWSLLRDRSRGRKRCPRCWYELGDIPPTQSEGRTGWVCPECGHLSHKAKSLLRTRRRWRVAILGAVLGAASWPVANLPGIRANGWWSLAPRVVLIAALPQLESGGSIDWRAPRNQLLEHLQRRIFNDEAFGRLLWPERTWLRM
jgi:hypothetical protein